MDKEKSPADKRDPRVVTGIVLITIGLLLFILQFVTGPTVSLIFMVSGGAFVVAYLRSKSYGLLVTGCLLVGIGIGHLGEQSAIPVRNMSSVGLGIGFIAIYVVDRFYRGKAAWWPLVPGLILLVTGAATGYIDFGKLTSKAWPLILVILGVLYLTGSLGSKGGASGGKPPTPPDAS